MTKKGKIMETSACAPPPCVVFVVGTRERAHASKRKQRKATSEASDGVFGCSVLFLSFCLAR